MKGNGRASERKIQTRRNDEETRVEGEEEEEEEEKVAIDGIEPVVYGSRHVYH